MRISRWPVLLCGWMLAVVGQTANAFDPAYENAFSPSNYAVGEEDGAGLFEAPSDDEGTDGTGGWAFQPVQYLEDGSAGMPMDGGGDPYYMQGGYPPNAWPGVSPYSQHNMEGVYNDGGIWRYEANDDERKHVFSTEFLIVWGLRPGSHVIGDSAYSSLAPSGGAGTTTGTTTTSGGSFRTYNSSQFSNLKHYGVKLRYGWENPDESGMILSGFWVAPNEAVKAPPAQFNRGFTTAPLASIAYRSNIFGQSIPNFGLFDETFSQTYDQEVWGADLDAYAAPFFRRQSFKVAATLGVKYLRIGETYSIRGSGSSTGPSQTFTGFPELNTEINASATSNLVGPQIGVRYDLGGERFKIWGQTKIAVAANMDSTSLFGRNAFGNYMPTESLIISPPSSNITFNKKQSGAHISPIFDQSIYGEFPLFSVLPLLNRLSFINRANFRVGYNLLIVNDMQRPASMIRYTEYDPGIRMNRTWFTLSTVNFSADWRF